MENFDKKLTTSKLERSLSLPLESQALPLTVFCVRPWAERIAILVLISCVETKIVFVIKIKFVIRMFVIARFHCIKELLQRKASVCGLF